METRWSSGLFAIRDTLQPDNLKFMSSNPGCINLPSSLGKKLYDRKGEVERKKNFGVIIYDSLMNFGIFK